jgi:hypothetical protein
MLKDTHYLHETAYGPSCPELLGGLLACLLATMDRGELKRNGGLSQHAPVNLSGMGE